MSTLKIGRSHKARKALFARGIRRGFLSVEEIDEALPSGSLTDAERWLLYYSLKAARVEIRDGDGSAVEVEERASDARRTMEEEIGDGVGFEAEADTQH
jgi:hypothetical protein